MKVQELRLHNLLQYEDNVVPVVGLNLEKDNDHSLVQIQQGNTRIPIHSQQLKPIRLTSEWLSKFGFVESYRSDSRIRYDLPNFGKYDFDLSKDKILEGFLYFGNYIRCHYIHQLQNLHFVLTGKELKVESN
ncbi:hypothetical protein [Epilithonimonas arachidiradicis]|uniref:Uncharacterized protein n=1 Tax=Epilithonimonas arachidiradicis TaxID=1617282 RepID=A0A420D8N7_9FLAO|nr:hypothetical protein [Epilithonimonas arachidiradicis]RKE87189.1 hypothetical protein BXY58_2065 [Epilithonimonas arachidiradicis]GGG59003.1 hypothetical protein GCM10007332_20820 [Epilithonimonas arachidiradicis]